MYDSRFPSARPSAELAAGAAEQTGPAGALLKLISMGE